MTITPSTTNVTCNGICDGTASASVTGGVSPYTYSWNTAPVQTAATATGLCAGAYTVSVTDATNCTQTETVAITQPTVITASITPTNASCSSNCDGSATATFSGGTAPYTYAWSSGCSTFYCSNLCVGTYSFTVVDANGCFASVVATITASAAFTYSLAPTNPSNCSACDGSISVSSINGGTPPYNYLWSPTGQTTSTITGLCSGTYSPMVTDSTGCAVSASTSLSVVSNLTVTIGSVTNASCISTCDGGATATISGGTPAYTYMWSNGSTSLSVTWLCAGNYSFTVTDSNGCYGSAGVYITSPPGFTFSFNSTNPSSCSACDGALSVASITGGTSPYGNYMWTPSGQTTTSITGLCSGSYLLSATDAAGCTSSSAYSIYTANNFTVTGTVTDAACFDGSIDITASNGVPPYTYLWSMGATTEDVSNLPPGNYSVTVTDAGVATCNTASAFFYVMQGPPGPACSQITGKVYYDANTDCVFNGTDAGLWGKTITAVPGPYYAVTNSSGDYSMLIPAGTYSVTQTLPANWIEECPGSGYSSVVANAASITPNIDFADTVLPVQDLSIWSYSGGAAPGFPRMYYLVYYNQGNIPMNATAYLVIDPLDNFTNATTTPSSVSGDTIFWNFNNLQPFQYYNYITVFCSNLPANPSLIGDTIFYCAKILPIAGDVSPANNTSCSFKIITGSYDPNAKEVSPEGTGPSGNILQTDTVLTYNIHFQNAGTASAQTVVVRDTLSPYLNPASVEDGPSSHAHTFSLSGNGILKWTFNNIMLPDSGSNFAGSNGYLTYRIHLKPNLSIGTIITNKGDIYFDYNPPITTNAVINTISNNNSVGDLNGANSLLKVYPNPSTGIFTITVEDVRGQRADVEIQNMLGAKVYSGSSKSSKTQIDISNYPQGIYFLQIQAGEKVISKKVIKY